MNLSDALSNATLLLINCFKIIFVFFSILEYHSKEIIIFFSLSSSLEESERYPGIFILPQSIHSFVVQNSNHKINDDKCLPYCKLTTVSQGGS